jgi:hypothetical protein
MKAALVSTGWRELGTAVAVVCSGGARVSHLDVVADVRGARFPERRDFDRASRPPQESTTGESTTAHRFLAALRLLIARTLLMLLAAHRAASSTVASLVERMRSTTDGLSSPLARATVESWPTA